MIDFISKLIRQFNNKIIFKCTFDQEKEADFVREKLCGLYAITFIKRKKRLGQEVCLSSSTNCLDDSVTFGDDDSIIII